MGELKGISTRNLEENRKPVWKKLACGIRLFCFGLGQDSDVQVCTQSDFWLPIMPWGCLFSLLNEELYTMHFL
jgi:hypothetical protein